MMRKNIFKRLFLTTLLSIIIFSLTDYHFSLAYEKEVKSLSLSIAENIVQSGKKTIAVVDFTDLQGNITELGRFLSEEFSTALVSTGKGFEVVDRIHLKSILEEHKLSLTGLIDPQTARKLGKIAGVDAIVTGTITPFGDSVRLSVKVLVTDTAKIIAASAGNIAKTEAIKELLARGIEAATAPPTAQTQQAKAEAKRESKGAGYVWEDGVLRVTVESLKKTGKSVIIKILYENISDKSIHVNLDPNYAHLLDENGGRWNLDQGSETAEIRGGREISLAKKIRSKMNFIAKDSDSDNGSIFDLFLKSYGGEHEYILTIQNMRVN